MYSRIKKNETSRTKVIHVIFCTNDLFTEAVRNYNVDIFMYVNQHGNAGSAFCGYHDVQTHA